MWFVLTQLGTCVLTMGGLLQPYVQLTTLSVILLSLELQHRALNVCRW